MTALDRLSTNQNESGVKGALDRHSAEIGKSDGERLVGTNAAYA
ncbi:MAG: hypothetical protein QM760_22960 [Nibricoccus sp.]